MVGLMNGVVITETIFNYPGMDSFLPHAALSLGAMSLLGVALFSIILVIGNLMVDVLYDTLSPLCGTGASIARLVRPTTYWISVTTTTKPAARYPTVGLRLSGQITHPA